MRRILIGLTIALMITPAVTRATDKLHGQLEQLPEPAHTVLTEQDVSAPAATTVFLPCDATEDGAWFETPVPKRTSWTGAFDSRRNRLILLGDGLWTLSFGVSPRWQALCATGTAPDAGLSAVYDSLRDRVVWLGLSQGSLGSYEPSLWLLQLGTGSAWRRIDLPHLASWPATFSLAYDAEHHRAFILADVESGRRRRTWSIDVDAPLAISELPPANQGDPLEGESILFDPERNRLMVFGGRSSSQLPGHAPYVFYVSTVSELDLDGPGGWIRILPTGAVPPGRVDASLVLDPGHARMLLAGGSNTAALNDAWKLELTGEAKWVRLTPDPSPFRAFAGVPGFYDATRDEFTLIGNYPEDHIWSLGLGRPAEWQPKVAAVPNPRFAEQMAHGYDSVHRRFILEGGGYWPTYLPGTRALDLDTDQFSWRLLTQAGPEPVLLNHSLIIDKVGDRAILFGGRPPSFYPSEAVWSLPLSAPAAWQQLQIPAPGPLAREGQCAIYDPVDRRMIVFGGGAPGVGTPVQFSDLWALSLSPEPRWTELRPRGAGPGPGFAARAVYDPDRDRMLVLGWYSSSGDSPNEVWELSLGEVPEWKRVDSLGQGPGQLHSVVYDDTRGRLVVYTYECCPTRGPLWELALRDSPTWRLLQPWGKAPLLVRHSAMYDPVTDRMITARNGRFHMVQWGEPPIPATIHVRRPRNSEGARAERRLTVTILGNSNLAVREIDLESLHLAGTTISHDGTGNVSASIRDVNRDGLDDAVAAFPANALASVRPGSDIILRGRMRQGRWIRGSTEMTSLPSGLSATSHNKLGADVSPLALRSLSPVPCSGPDLRLSIFVPSEGPLELECFDIRGRRVWAEHQAAPRIGLQTLSLPIGRSWRTGIYFVRAGHEGVYSTVRVILTY